jgi:hypothetical protein
MKSIIGLGIYIPILVTHELSYFICDCTQDLLDWLTTDEPMPGDPDGPVDGDKTDDI